MVPSLGGTNWERSEALEGVLCVGFFLAAAANEIIYVSCRAFYVICLIGGNVLYVLDPESQGKKESGD